MLKKASDANQAKLMEQIRRLGFSVRSIHTVGKGMPDLLVGCRKTNYLFEVKDPAKSKSQKKLTPDEEVFHSMWKGQVDIVETIEDVIKIINP